MSTPSDQDTGREATLVVRIPIIESDANELGEALRRVTFVGDGYGCYSTFEVRPDAREFPHAVARSYFEQDGEYDEWLADVEFQGCAFDADGLTIECFWYWDGDGVLSFRISDEDGVLRIIENTDCKKASHWVDWEARPAASGSEEDA